ncbi:hypothetical protein [Mycobacteroides abscessus]|uniref:hypothetical protein n=1 Tax=Mycobacteroides abscessus TaxID=36809 RepID=UPI000940CDDA|nr:hypothetical protein [Mycobacteroides abscessus]
MRSSVSFMFFGVLADGVGDLLDELGCGGLRFFEVSGQFGDGLLRSGDSLAGQFVEDLGGAVGRLVWAQVFGF